MFRFGPTDEKVDTFAPEVEVRAVIEGQVMAKLVHAQRLGYQITSSSRVLVTGGASQNQHICQVQSLSSPALQSVRLDQGVWSLGS